MTSSRKVRHLAVPRVRNDIFATAEFESDVTVWSYKRRERLACFKTPLDFGGNRLAILSAPEPIVAAGSYKEELVCTYNGINGNILWSREGLKELQQICDLSNESISLLGIGREGKPFQILDASSGQTIATLPQVREVYAGSFSPMVLQVLRESVRLPETEGPEHLWEKPLDSFGVLHAAISPTQVAYSEAGGKVYCYDHQANLCWDWNPDGGRHVLRIAWNGTDNCWVAVDWNYERGGPKRLLRVSHEGRVSITAAVGEPPESEFFKDGQYLIISTGQVIDTISGKIDWTFMD